MSRSADEKTADLRRSGFTGPVDSEGNAVMSRTDGNGKPLPLFEGGTGHGTKDDNGRGAEGR